MHFKDMLWEMKARTLDRLSISVPSLRRLVSPCYKVSSLAIGDRAPVRRMARMCCTMTSQQRKCKTIRRCFQVFLLCTVLITVWICFTLHRTFNAGLHVMPTETTMVLKNVCVDSTSAMYFPWLTFFITVFGDAAKAYNYGSHADMPFSCKAKSFCYWRVFFSNNNVESEDFEDAVLFLPTYWRFGRRQTIWILFNEVAPRVLGLAKWAKNGGIKGKTDWTKKKMYLAAPAVFLTPAFTEAYNAMGFTEVIDTLWTGRRCFKHAVIGQRQSEISRQEISAQFIQTWNITETSTCAPNTILFIQRTESRKLLNLEELIAAVRELGLSNIKVVELEKIPTLREQIEIVRCAKLIIAVQGAALGWFTFFQDNAMVVEIIYENWPSRYAKRFAAIRPDIEALVMTCQIVTSDEQWSYMAWYFWIPHIRLTDSLKQKVIEKSLKGYPIGHTIWKYSDVSCDPKMFKKSISDWLVQHHML